MAGVVPALLVVALHLAVNASRLAQEAFLIAGITLLGVLVEGGLLASGIITYAGTEAGRWAPPIWIIALWFGFGTLPHASLGWLSGRWVLQDLLGAICGPLSYVAGEAVRRGADRRAAPVVHRRHRSGRGRRASPDVRHGRRARTLAAACQPRLAGLSTRPGAGRSA